MSGSEDKIVLTTLPSPKSDRTLPIPDDLEAMGYQPSDDSGMQKYYKEMTVAGVLSLVLPQIHPSCTIKPSF
jgi:hypothetical protein